MANQHYRIDTPRRRRRFLIPTLALLAFAGLSATTAAAADPPQRSADRDRGQRVEAERAPAKVAADRRSRRDRSKTYRYDRRDRRQRYDRREDRRYDRRGDRRYDRRDDRRNRYDRWTKHRYSYDEHRRYHHRHHYRGSSHHSFLRRFAIPKLIAHELAHTLSDFFLDRVYYRDHGHYHDIYRFPVYLEHGVEYRPYAYCEGKYFAAGRFERYGPGLELTIRF